MDTVMRLVAVAGALAGLVMWVANTVRHRRHLSQCVQDLQRQ